jgi:hypothetical protein
MVNTWKIILATVVIFGAGVITGGLLVNHANHAKVKQLRTVVPGAQPGHWTPPLREFPRRPENELQLSFEQRRMEFLLNATRELKLTPPQNTSSAKARRTPADFGSNSGPRCARNSPK